MLHRTGNTQFVAIAIERKLQGIVPITFCAAKPFASVKMGHAGLIIVSICRSRLPAAIDASHCAIGDRSRLLQPHKIRIFNK